MNFCKICNKPIKPPRRIYCSKRCNEKYKCDKIKEKEKLKTQIFKNLTDQEQQEICLSFTKRYMQKLREGICIMKNQQKN